MRLIDHPMLPFDLGCKIVAAWALGDNAVGYGFGDLDFQGICDEQYRLAGNGMQGLPASGPTVPGLAETTRLIRARLIKLWRPPENLAHGKPELN
jgi:hypothetical protein